MSIQHRHQLRQLRLLTIVKLTAANDRRTATLLLWLQTQLEQPFGRIASWMRASQTSHACSLESLAGLWMLHSPTYIQ